jgi:hypothetical protein
MWTDRFPLEGIDIPSLKKEGHVYSDKSGNIYKSVSSILSLIKPKFDVETKSMEYASKRKMNIDDVLKLWEDKKNTGLNYGTDVHENIENYFINEKIENIRYKEVVEDIHDKVYDKNGINELICFDLNKKICGTSDYVVFKENDFYISDFKTNKKFNFENQFEDKFLLEPVSHLPNSEYFIYALQLSFYAKMIENLSGLKCGGLDIFWLKRQIETKDIFKAKWMKYKVPYLREEVEQILCIV